VPQATGDARLDNNPFFHDRLRTNIDRGLEARGYRPGGTAADLRVHYHATVRERIDVNSADLERGFCEGSACRPFIYSAGFILIDLVDERTGTLVWRGWADGTFDGVLEDQDVMEEAVDEAVARILERLPRRP
jgi:hypothetical protein